MHLKLIKLSSVISSHVILSNTPFRDDFYRSYVLAHIKNLVYLDYR